MLKDRLEEVEHRIEEACRRAGRKREEVTLIAVSKTKPVETFKGGIRSRYTCIRGEQSSGTH